MPKSTIAFGARRRDDKHSAPAMRAGTKVRQKEFRSIRNHSAIPVCKSPVANGSRSSAPMVPEKSTLFNLISGRFQPTSGDIFAQGREYHPAQAIPNQSARLVTQFSDHEYFFHRLSVYEKSALRGAMVAWLPLFVLATPGRLERCASACGAGAGADRVATSPQQHRRRIDLRRTTGAGDWHHDRRRRRRDPAG
ncbi:ATP-binding cassette domain-containing protein [Undibacterium arcticum]